MAHPHGLDVGGAREKSADSPHRLDGARRPVLAARLRSHASAQVLREELHAVADAEHRHAASRTPRVGSCGAPSSDTLAGPPERMTAAHVRIAQTLDGRWAGNDLAEDARLAHAPRDELRVLRSEVEDRDTRRGFSTAWA